MKSLKPFVSTVDNKTYIIYATDAQEAKNNLIQNVLKKIKNADEIDLKIEELPTSSIVVDAH